MTTVAQLDMPDRVDVEALIAVIREVASLGSGGPAAPAPAIPNGADEGLGGAMRAQAEFNQVLVSCLAQLGEAVRQFHEDSSRHAREGPEALARGLAEVRGDLLKESSRDRQALEQMSKAAGESAKGFGRLDGRVGAAEKRVETLEAALMLARHQTQQESSRDRQALEQMSKAAGESAKGFGQLDGRVGAAEKRIETLEAELTLARHQTQQVETRAGEALTRLADRIVEQTSFLTAPVNALAARIRDAEHHVQRLDAELALARRRGQQIEIQGAETVARLAEQIEKQAARFTTPIDDLAARVAAAEECVEDFRSHRALARSEAEQSEARAAETVTRIAERINERAAELAAPIDVLAGRVEAAEQHVKHLEAELTRAKHEAQETGTKAADSLARLTEQIHQQASGLAAPIEGLNTRVGAAEQHVNRLEAELASAKREAQQAGTKAAESLARLTEQMNQRAPGLAAPIEGLNGRVGAAEQSIKRLETELGSAKREAQQQAATKAAESTGRLAEQVNQRVSALAAPMAALDGRVGAAEQQVKRLDGELAAAKREAQQALAKAAEAAARAAEQETKRTAGLSAPIEGLNARVGSAEQHIQRLETELASARREAQQGTAKSSEAMARLDQFNPRTAELTARIDDLKAKTGAADQGVKRLETELNATKRETQQAATKSAEAVARLVGEVDQRTAALAGRIDGIESKLGPAEQFSRQLDEFRIRLLRAERGRGNGRPALPPEEPFDYFLFEHRFRGSFEEIKRRQRAYLDFFGTKRQVLDIGCGRGEFVELLGEQGVGVRGIDANEDMVDFGLDRHLPVTRAEMFQHLAHSPQASLDGIFMAQVVEHLPPPRILRLLRLCAGALAPGGVLAAETVNTNCLGVLSNFYLDPTHIRPVPAELLRFLFEQAGLRIDRLRFSAPLPGRNLPPVLDVSGPQPEQTQYYQDYAVIAVQTGARPGTKPDLEAP